MAVELDVDDGADDLGDAALGDGCGGMVGVFLAVLAGSSRLFLEGFGAGDDLDQLLGDLRLAGTVHIAW